MNTHIATFDKLVYLDRLKLAGVAEDTARAHAEALDQALRESVATKSDIERLEARFNAEIKSLQHDLEKTETGLRGEITANRHDLAREIEAAKNSTLRWTFGFNIVLVGAIFGIIKFVH